MKKIYFILSFLLLYQTVFAQMCGTDEIHQALIAKDSVYARNIRNANTLLSNLAEKRNQSNHKSMNPSIPQQQQLLGVNACDSVYTIPVVVHVIHTGQGVGAGYNVSDTTIQNAIAYASQRFRNTVLVGGTYPSVDVGIEFELAKRDTNDSPTTGIVRVNASYLTNYVNNGVNLYNTQGISDSLLKSLSVWNQEKYYNIWIVNTIDGFPSQWGGYAYFPSNPPYYVDGTVLAYNSINHSLTHELGHAFGLFHTFQGYNGNSCPPNANCNIDGDAICDTEPHLINECGSSSICTGNSTLNTVKNHMSYCNARNRFTQGQKNRMRDALFNLRPYFLTTEKLIPANQANEAGIKDIIIANGGLVCVSYSPQIIIKNYGINTLNNITFDIIMDGTLVQTHIVPSLNISTNGLDTLQLPSMMVGYGNHLLEIHITDINGSGIDTYIPNNKICLTIHRNPEQTNFPYCNDFDNGELPSNWTYINQPINLQTTPFFIDTITITSCIQHNKAIVFKNYADQWVTNNDLSSLNRSIITNEIDLNNVISGNLLFDVSTKQEGFCSDITLNIDVSTDCGSTFTNIYHKNNMNTWYSNNNCNTVPTIMPLHTVTTVPNAFTTEYIPTNDNEWRKDTVNLNSYAGNTVMIRFSVIVNDSNYYGAQPLYLDNICIKACYLNASISSTNLTCHTGNGDPNGTINVTVNGSYSTPTYSWNTGQTSQSIINAVAGIYTCRITDSLGCEANVSATLTQPPLLSANLQVLSGSATICQGDTVKLSCINSAGLTYQWRKNGVNIGGAISSNYNATQSGLYSVIVSNASGCKDTGQVSVTINLLPTANLTNVGSLTFCDGSLVTLNANIGAGLTYEWQNSGNIIIGANTSSYVATIAGSYTVVVTDANGCQKTSLPKNIVVNPSPVTNITASGSTTFCIGDTVTLSTPLQAGYTYQWKKNGTNITGGINNNYAAYQSGAYTVVATLGNCKDTSSIVNVVANPLPTATLTNVGSLTFCDGSSVTLNANIGAGLSYEWKNSGNIIMGANTSSYIATVAGSYTVVVTDSNSCQKTSLPKNVLVNPSPVTNITASGSTTFCIGDTVTLSTPLQAGYTYQWKKNGTNITGGINNNYAAYQSGAYTVVATLGTCKDTSSIVNVVANPLPTATLTNVGSLTFCDGSSVTLNANIGAGLSYEWQNSGNIIIGANTSSYIATVAGSYTVVVTDSNSCQKTSLPKNVVVNPTPIASITTSGSPSICTGDTVTITTPIQAGYTYQWKKNNVNIAGAINNSYDAYQSGSYIVIVSLGTCKDTSIATNVIINPLPFVGTNASGLIACVGDSVTLWGTGASTYIWQGSVQNGVAFIPNGTATYWVEGTDSNGCRNTASVTIIIDALSLVANTNANPVCQGDNLTLTGSGANSYYWDNGVQNGIPFIINTTQTYTLIGMTLNGCSDTSSITITVNPLPTVTANASSNAVCQGNSVILTGSGANTYTWNNGTQDGVSFVPNATQTYMVTGTDVNGCIDTDNITITVNSLPTLTISQLGNVLSVSQNYTSYQWFNGQTPIVSATDYSYTPLQNGSYFVQITDSNGCIGISDTINFILNGLDNLTSSVLSIYPNPTNHTFTIEFFKQDNYSMNLYNALGQLLISSKLIEQKNQVDISKYVSGVYFIEVFNSNTQRTVMKVMKE